jgi:outer membrane protein TolC
VAEARRGEAEAEREAEWVSARRAAGDATVLDEALAGSEVARWVGTRAEAEVRLAIGRAELGALVGEPDAATAATTSPEPPAFVEPSSEARIAAWIEASPPLATLRAEGGYWDAARRRAEAERTPPLGLILLGGRGDFGEARLGGGLSFTFPVARKNQGEIARADAERARAQALEAGLRAALLARLRGAVAASSALRAATAALEAKGVPAAERAAEAATAAFRAGKIELAGVLFAKRELSTARARRLDLLEARWRALGVLASVKGELP